MALFIRASSVYLDGKKMGTVSKGSKNTNSNGSLVPGDGGVALGWAKGMTTNDLTIDFAILFAGNTETQKLTEALETGAAVKIQNGIVDGKVESGEYFIDSRKIDWDHEKGTCNGSIMLKAGAETRT